MKKSSGPNAIERGQSVVIKYDARFRKEYPHTAALFEGKKGTVKGFEHLSGIAMIEIYLIELGRPALVDAKYLFPA
jgi:ribosomal protein L21E